MLEVVYVSPDGEVIETFEMADGLTISQAAHTICPDTEGKFPVPVIALVGATPAVRGRGDWDVELTDCHVQFRQLAQGGGGGGGGSNAMQMVFQVAIIALAAIATWYVGGTGAIAGISALGYGSIAGTMAGMAVMVAGTLLGSLIFKQNTAKASGLSSSYEAASASPTYSINASGNQARLYQTEPEGFGRMKIVPDFVANTWTEYSGNDQFGYFVYSVGRGYYDIESLQFGETVFWRRDLDAEPIQYKTTSTKTQDVYLSLTGTAQSMGVFPTDTADVTDKLNLTVNFPNGLGKVYRYMRSKNNIGNVYTMSTGGTATFYPRVRLAGTDNAWTSLSTFTATGNGVKTITLPSAGRWELDLRYTASLNDLSGSQKSGKYKLTQIGSNSACRITTVSMTAVTSHPLEYDDEGEYIVDPRAYMVADSPYEIQDIQFVQPGEAVTIFPDNVVTSSEVSGQELFGPNDAEYDGVIGPYTTNQPGTYTNKLLFDFVFQQGLGKYQDSGALGSFTVSWIIEYRPIDDFGNATGSWATLENCKLTAATLTPQRLTKTYNVAEGRYEVRIRRTSNTTSDGRTLDNLVWSAMRAMLPGTYQYPISCVAFSVKANNALTQNASSQFSLIATRKLPLYNRVDKTWSRNVRTRSWAAAISHICKIEWGGNITDANIDLDTLWNIDEVLQAQGWYYDSYIDGAYLVWDLLTEACQSQCVIPRFIGPVLSFVQDAPNREPTFALTPRNIVRNSFGITYATWSDSTPDDVILEYLDADYGFQQRDVTATLPESESKEPYTLQILGITDRDHAHKVAVAYAAHNRWQRIQVECQVENMGRIINRGDVCTVSHPRFKNTMSGMVQGFDKGLLKLTLKTDTLGDLPDASSAGYWLSLSQPNGQLWGPVKLQSIESTSSSLGQYTAILEYSDYATLLLQGASEPFDWIMDGLTSQPTTFTLYTAQTYQRLMQVESVTAQDFMHYNLSLVNYDSRVYQYDDLEVPLWQGRGQLPTVTSLSAPTGLSAVTITETRVRLTWVGVARANYYEVETSTDNDTWVYHGKFAQNQAEVTVPEGIYYARVRACSDGLVSTWASVTGNTLLKTAAAPDVTATAYTGGEATLTWDAVDGADTYIINVMQGTDVLHTTEQAETSFTVTAEIQTGGPYRALSVTVACQNEAGVGEATSLTLSDPLPSAPTEAVYTVQTETDTTIAVKLESVSPDNATDKTGYALVRGNSEDFSFDDVSELKLIDSLPSTWKGLPSDEGILYFRIAVTDAFWAISKNIRYLNWSGVLMINPSASTSAEEEEDDG